MADIKLYLRTALAPGASDLFYLTRADGSADGPCSFTSAASVFAGVLSTTFAPLSHTHTASQVSDFSTAADARIAAAVGVTVQAYYTPLATYGGIAPSANVQTVLGAANYAAIRTALTLVIGTDVQAYSANLTTYAAIAPSANVQTLLGAANFAAFRSSLGLGAVALLATVTEADQTFADNTTANVTSAKHGYAPKSPADATKFLNGAATPDYALVKDSDLSTSDVTTNNATTAKHGFLKKLSNSATEYMDGTGNWSTPAGSGGGGSTTIVPPQGRLTLTSNTPVMVADVTGATSVYFTPYRGRAYPNYVSSAWTMRTFTQLTLSLDTTNHPIWSLFDVFLFNDGGTDKIGTGPAWAYSSTVTITNASPGVVTWTAHGLKDSDPVVFTTSGGLPTGLTAGTVYFVTSGSSITANTFRVSTSIANAVAGTSVNTSSAGSGTHTCTCAVRTRGTGAGTTEIEIKEGFPTNKNTITLKNGAGAGVTGVAANAATYVGTILTTAAGQTSMMIEPTAASGGCANILGVANIWNLVRMTARSHDNGVNYTYASPTWRTARASAANRITYIDPLGEAYVIGHRISYAYGSAPQLAAAINRDSTTATPALVSLAYSNGGQLNFSMQIHEEYTPSIGMHFLQAMEASIASITLNILNNDQNASERLSLEIYY